MSKQITKCFVGGVSGVGKTTVLAHLHLRSIDCEVINGSQLMFDALRLPKGDYAALRALPAGLKDRVFGDLVRRLLDRAESTGRSVLIDGHYLNFSNGTARPVAFEWVGKMDVLVLIDADPTIIRDRMKPDKRRADQSAGGHQLLTIQTSLEQTRAEAKRLSMKYRKPLRTVKNASDLDSAVEMLGHIAEIRLEDSNSRQALRDSNKPAKVSLPDF